MLHAWVGRSFDLVTGRPLCLPATEPVPTFEVRVHDGNVEVGLKRSANNGTKGDGAARMSPD